MVYKGFSCHSAWVNVPSELTKSAVESRRLCHLRLRPHAWEFVSAACAARSFRRPAIRPTTNPSEMVMRGRRSQRASSHVCSIACFIPRLLTVVGKLQRQCLSSVSLALWIWLVAFSLPRSASESEPLEFITWARSLFSLAKINMMLTRLQRYSNVLMAASRRFLVLLMSELNFPASRLTVAISFDIPSAGWQSDPGSYDFFFLVRSSLHWWARPEKRRNVCSNG